MIPLIIITFFVVFVLLLILVKPDKEITAGIITIVLMIMFVWQFCMTRQIQKDIMEIKTELHNGGK